jgi:hypothetical protein
MSALQLTISAECNCTGTNIFKSNTNSFNIGKNFPFAIKHDLTVCDNHVKFEYISEKWHMSDVSTYGTFTRLIPACPVFVKYGIYIVCGKTWICTNIPDCIDVINEKFEIISRFKPEMNVEYTIGRSEMDSIVIKDDTSMSQFHAKLTFNDKGVMVTDWKDGQGSTNGTFISLTNKEITDPCILRIGLETFCKVEVISASQYMAQPPVNSLPVNMQYPQQNVQEASPEVTGHIFTNTLRGNVAPTQKIITKGYEIPTNK